MGKVGHVTVPQMLHVLRALHSQARGPDAPYFVAMVDPLGKGDLTFQELAMAMKACVEAGTLAWQKGNAQVSAVISKVKAHLMDRHATVLSLFREFDRTGRGYLELGDLLRLFRRAVREDKSGAGGTQAAAAASVYLCVVSQHPIYPFVYAAYHGKWQRWNRGTPH